MKIPNLVTKEEKISEMRDSGVPMAEVFLQAMWGDLRRLPTYNDSDEVLKRAYKDIKNLDFSNMGDYLGSLEQIVDYWKEKAEHYVEFIDRDKYQMDEDGYIQEKNTN